MIRKLRQKFILTTMSILTVLFVVVIIVLNCSFAQAGVRQNLSFLHEVAQNGGIPARLHTAPADAAPPADGAADSSQTMPQGAQRRDFAMTDALAQLLPLYGGELENGQVTLVTALSDSAEDTEGALAAAQKAIAASGAKGQVGHWLYCLSDRGDYLALMDASGGFETQSQHRLLVSSLAVSAGVLVVLYFVCLWLSRFVTRPAEETFNKQKQFISDASHELKTPLSVIAINADVLSGEIGPSKYMDYIQSETRRMDRLIHQLLELSRMDDASRPLQKSQFSLSDAMYEVALPFESTAFEQQVNYQTEIEENLTYTGEAESLKQLAAILLDNAFKHTPAGGEIVIALKARGTGAQLTVRNTGEGICDDDLPHIFERFYRCDKSRTDSGSYGLGLAIAQSIVTAHGGSLKAESRPGQYTLFTALL